MKIKKLLFFASLFIPFGLLAQFTVQDPGFTEHYEITYVDAVNESLVWVVAKDQSGNNLAPVFSVSQNGGESWASGYLIQDDGLAPAMVFAFEAFPYAFVPLYKSDPLSSNPAGIYATFDGGETWARQAGIFEEATAWPDIVHFWNTTQGIAIGDPVDVEMEIYTTTDLGTTWIKVPDENIPDPLPGEAAIIGNFDVVGSTIWFSTTKGRIFRSVDYGQYWDAFSTPFSLFTKANFKDENFGWIQNVGQWEFSQIARTADGGQTWDFIEHSGPLLNWDLDYIPGSTNTLISSGAYLNNGISMSYDGGENWYWMEEQGTKYFKMDWLDGQTGWVGGYDEQIQKPIIYKYTGPGVGDYLVSPQDIYFGYAAIGTSTTRNITITNLGLDILEITDIYTNIGIFSVTPSSCSVDPEGGQYILEVTFTPTDIGVYEDWVTIISNHPIIPEVNVHLMGDGYIPANNILFNPDSFNETLSTGQTVSKSLSMTNNTGTDLNYRIDVACEPSLAVLGWNIGSTPLGCDDGILCGEADQAMFIKQFTLDEFNDAMLYIGCDDGGRFWVNGTLVLDELYGDHGLDYWNYELDISPYLSPGINRISAVVFNGMFRGCCEGAFDCQLTIDGVDVIKKGEDNYGVPEAQWFFFGQSGAQLEPPADVNGKNWWESGYGQYNWVKMSETSGGTGFEGLGWKYLSAPFGGNELLLNESPDNAFFIKDFEITTHNEATLFLSYDDGCLVILNGGLIYDFHDENHSPEYWNQELDISAMLIEGRNRLSIVVYNGVYGGGGQGAFDCHLLVDGVEVIRRGDMYNGDPKAFWYVYGEAGQVLTPPDDSSGSLWWEMGYALNETSLLTNLGWYYNSTPVFENENLLNQAPDNAQFIKDFYVENYSWATLSLAFDDGCIVWLNGNLVLDYYQDVHGMNYWNREDDVTAFLVPGRNRIAVEVYNGMYGGGGSGGFDCQLVVDDVPIIMRGDENFGQPAAMWYFYGQAGQVLTPPQDPLGLQWFMKDYGFNKPEYSNTLTGFLADGQTDEIQVMMDATGLSGGEYQTHITFAADVLEEELFVPVSLFVNPEAVLEISPSSLDFGDFYLGYPESLNLTLKNTGFETLDIINIWSDAPDISTDFNSVSLASGESTILTITLDSWDEGPFFSSLNFQSLSLANPTQILQITANRMVAPSFVLENVEYLYAWLASGQTETQNLHIDNWGGSPLTFTIPHAESKNQISLEAKSNLPGHLKPLICRNSNESLRKDTPVFSNHDIIGHKNLVVKNHADESKKVAVAGQIDLFKDDMENGPSNWTIKTMDDGESQWHIVKSNYYSPDASWWCGNERTGTYFNNNNVSEAIISTEIVLPPVEASIMLEFNEWYEIENGFDQGFVDISLDGGNEWITIREGIPGSSGGWISTVLDLSQFYGNTIKIRFYFETDDNIANDYPGWFIDDVRVYVDGIAFLNSSPASGTVNVWEGFDINVTFNATDYNQGWYPGFILLKTNDPENQWFYLPATMEVYGENWVQNFELPAGWSGISSYLIPENPQLDQILNPILNELVIFQNLEGVYWPQENLNSIGDWNYLNGYFLKLNNTASLQIAGTLPENRQIQMPAGWSLIPVLSENPVPVTDFDPLESLNIIKEVAGTGVYWPVYNINTLQELQPGKSYFIHVSSDEYFEFPPLAVKNGAFVNLINGQLISPWNEVTRTAATHIVALPAQSLATLKVGDVIGIFDQEGYCAGFLAINNLSQNQSIAVFVDDPTTAVKEGFSEGETMQFKLFRPSTNQTVLLETTFDPLLPNQGYFASNGLSAISGLKEATSNLDEPENTYTHLFPNPTNGILQIWSLVPLESLEVINQTGICVLKVYTKFEPSDQINISALPAGIYQVRMVTSGKTVVQKIVKR